MIVEQFGLTVIYTSPRVGQWHNHSLMAPNGLVLEPDYLASITQPHTVAQDTLRTERWCSMSQSPASISRDWSTRAAALIELCPAKGWGPVFLSVCMLSLSRRFAYPEVYYNNVVRLKSKPPIYKLIQQYSCCATVKKKKSKKTSLEM